MRGNQRKKGVSPLKRWRNIRKPSKKREGNKIEEERRGGGGNKNTKMKGNLKPKRREEREMEENERNLVKMGTEDGY